MPNIAHRGGRIQQGHPRIGVGSQLIQAVTRPTNPAFGQPMPSVAPPFDPALEARRAAGEARRTTLLSDLEVDVQQQAQEAGFKYDPSTGQFGGFDPTNPFSQAALLMKTRDESLQNQALNYQRGTSRSRIELAGAGQLYAGAYESNLAEQARLNTKRVGDIGFNYDKGYDTLRRSFENYVKNYTRRKRDISVLAPEDVATL